MATVAEGAAVVLVVTAATAWSAAVWRRRRAGQARRNDSPDGVTRTTEGPLSTMALFVSVALAVEAWDAELGIPIWLSIAMTVGAAVTYLAPQHELALRRLPAIALCLAALALMAEAS